MTSTTCSPPPPTSSSVRESSRDPMKVKDNEMGKKLPRMSAPDHGVKGEGKSMIFRLFGHQVAGHGALMMPLNPNGCIYKPFIAQETAFYRLLKSENILQDFVPVIHECVVVHYNVSDPESPIEKPVSSTLPPSSPNLSQSVLPGTTTTTSTTTGLPLSTTTSSSSSTSTTVSSQVQVSVSAPSPSGSESTSARARPTSQPLPPPSADLKRPSSSNSPSSSSVSSNGHENTSLVGNHGVEGKEDASERRLKRRGTMKAPAKYASASSLTALRGSNHGSSQKLLSQGPSSGSWSASVGALNVNSSSSSPSLEAYNLSPSVQPNSRPSSRGSTPSSPSLNPRESSGHGVLPRPLVPTRADVIPSSFEDFCDPNVTPPGPNSFRYIVMEDLTNGFIHPAMLDLKIGTRQHGRYAKPDKAARAVAKCKSTTSASLGYRFCGLQVHNPVTGILTKKDKMYGRSLTKDTVIDALAPFFTPGSGLSAELIQEYKSQLTALKSQVEGLDGYRFYSASLLFVYDTAAWSPSPKDSPIIPKVTLKLIDFAHSFADRVAEPGPDQGHLLGLTSLIAAMDTLLSRATRFE